MLNDLRYAFRMLMKSPGFTVVAVVTLALGIGSTTAIYSAVNTLILNPLPMPRADRFVQIGELMLFPGQPTHYGGVSPPVLEALRAEQEVFTDLAWFESCSLERKTEDFIDRMWGYAVSPNFFSELGVAPMLGRTFAADEGERETEYRAPKGNSVIVLGYATWMSLYGSDEQIIGKQIELSDRQFTIIGVMPREFQFPEGSIRFWVPSLDERVLPNMMKASNCTIFVPLKEGISPRQAQVCADTVAQRTASLHGSTPGRGYEPVWSSRKGLTLFARPLQLMFADRGQDLRQTFFGLLGAVQFILLIVCANVANLTLAKAEGRQQEFAVRAALGAGRWRLIQQSLTESILLACLGGLAGLLVANWGVQFLSLRIPESMPRMRAIRIDQTALLISAMVSLATGILFGLAPAWRAGHTYKLHDSLKQSGSGATLGSGGKWLRGTLVVAEVGLTVVLMAGAGLMIQSVVGLLRTDPGYSIDNLIRVGIELPFEKYAGPNKVGLKNTVMADIHERLSAVPGVSGVGIGRDADFIGKIILDGRTQPEPVDVLYMGTGVGASDSLKVMGVPLLVGRYLEPADIPPAAGTVVINQMMAELFWPGENAIGKRFRAEGGETRQIVGVVGNSRSYSLSQQIAPAYYGPYQEFDYSGAPPFYVVRASTDPGTLIGPIRKALIAAEPAMRLPTIGLFGDLLYQSTQAQRTYMLYLMGFAATGVLLSAIGIYGVLAYSVARRTREIGIRMAMGAQRGDLIRVVLKEGIRLALIGSALGLVAAYGLTRFLQHQLHGVSPTDPAVFAGVVVVLLGVAFLACYVPARRATKVDPMTALRSE